MNDVKIGAALSAGWSAFMRRPWYLLGLMFSFMAIFVLSLGNAIVTALAYIVYGGYLKAFIKHFRGGKIEFDDIFSLDNRWISFAFLAIIKLILLTLGFICFVIPGVYFAVRWMFAEMLVIDKGMKPVEALRASSKMTEGIWWPLFLFVLAMAVLSILSVLVLVVGVFIFAIIALFAYIKVYEDLKDRASEAE